ncbi:polysaccharide deacetylase family protein [Reinekea thalattae]|uniref:Polysaccharide deacetylase family protein n=1 Tax=Reinekea thalattae TaxID=2593301 RepID=A0A5C8ZDJ2_9GAMM|nr:polysaccharide deacetylase family protein [Reinekea thalattae]TXR54860.1 polysaccharide deacetylase family protein [Reinekea thalattae]
MRNQVRLLALIVGLFSGCYSYFFGAVAFAAGPEKIAYFDRAIWPQTIDSNAVFNTASRYEIYHFALAFNALDREDADSIAEFTGIENTNLESLARWSELTEQRLVAAYNASCADECNQVDSTADILTAMQPQYAKLDARYDAWKVQSLAFHQRYLYEQVRLAVLFPRISSEILSFNDSEISGFEFNDLEFALSFDDGPSLDKTTEKVTETLNNHDLSAVFFLLGERLELHGRDNIKQLYDQQCVASHGYIHKAHPRLEDWKNSVDKTAALLDKNFQLNGTSTPFRPPYGQRNEDMLSYLSTAHGSKNILWNIDSQDWNRSISAQDEASRVITLMLLWRKGFILFHDLYDKNLYVINQLSDVANVTDAYFSDCSRYAPKISLD